MTDQTDGRPWGACSAFGCQLNGSLGSEGKWWCFAHHNRPVALNDGITREIKARMALANASLDIRQFYGTDDWPTVYRGIQRMLIEANRRDMLIGSQDVHPGKPGVQSVRQWLLRIESELIAASNNQGRQVPIPLTVPTAGIVGPTHAMEHYSQESDA